MGISDLPVELTGQCGREARTLTGIGVGQSVGWGSSPAGPAPTLGSVRTNCRTPQWDLQRMGRLVGVREKVTYLMSEVL